MDFRRVSIFLLGVICLIQSSDATVTAWSAPLPGISANANGTITAAGTIAENAAVGTILFTANATLNAAGKVSYALTNTSGGKGTINSTTGVVTLATGQSIDFETTPTLVFVIEATDGSDQAKGTATVTLSITDEVPVFPSATQTACIKDQSAAGTALGTYTVTHPDPGDTLTYSIASGDSGSEFAIDGSTGEITVGKTLAAATYTLVVQAVNNAKAMGSTTVSVTVGDCVTVTITDSNKAPAFSSISSTACINDNSAAGTTLGTYTATDTDAGDTLSYSIASTGNYSTDFEVDPSTGVITVAPGKKLSKARTATYALVINAIDNAVPPKTGTTTISVTVGECSGTAALMSCISLMFVALFATLFVKRIV
ncbi:cadherin-24-like [Mya arenaria]|uniref:cadherin-24-like n=1 Tax=Mya arenaria TaxID=6604 RepID=UPI0022E68CAD|nr:cadherin-24-like [Mya arenaria]